jgi:hypothetical protein
MRTVAIHLLLAAGVTSAAHAQLLPPPEPGDEQPRADVTRQARPVMQGPAAAAAQGQLLPPPKPGDEQPRADITRGAQGALKPGATRGRQSDWCEEDCRKAPGTGAGPTVPGGTRASGPGTQTEDDIYIGRKVQGNVTPGPASMKPLTPQGPLAAPANPQLVRPVVGQDGGTQGSVDPFATGRSQTPQAPLAAPANPQLVRPAMPGGARGRPSDWCEEDCRKAKGLPDNKPSSLQPKEQPGGEQPRGERRQ